MPSISGYYACVNVLARQLPPALRGMLLDRWEEAGRHSLSGAHRSSIAGDVVTALQELLGVHELEALQRPLVAGQR